jgi:hypothetical protein
MHHSSKDAQCISLLYEQLTQVAAAPAAAAVSSQVAPQPIAPQQQLKTAAPFALRTFGDLKAVINRVKSKQKIGNVANVAANVAIDGIIGLVPGLASAKTVFDFFKAATARSDTQKTKSFIDQLDVDDAMSKIVDDTIENEFLQNIEKIINAYPNATPIPANWNMTNELVKFLRNKYKTSPAVLQHLVDITTQVP